MNVRVLIVDAHEDTRGSLARRLERDERLEVAAHVATIQEAESAVRDFQIDIMLLDAQSHAGIAVEQCQALHQLADVPLVVLASFMTIEDWGTLRTAGAADYLLKPAGTKQLSDAIVRLATRHGMGSKSVS
jgi:DNA-binding NarL/FixJ family response regulator